MSLHYRLLFFLVAARDLLYVSSHSRISHTTAFVTLVVEHWLEREAAQCDQLDDPLHHKWILYH